MKLPARSAWLALSAATVVWLAWLLWLPRADTWLVLVSGLPLIALASKASALARTETWRSFFSRTCDWHAVALLLLFALGVQFEDAHGVTTDGVIYFTQLRSVVFDGDLDVAREYAFLQQPPRPAHVVPIGPIPVWAPLYLAVATVDALGRALGLWAAPADPAALGLTQPYVRAVLMSSFAIGAIGVFTVHRMLRREFSALPAFAATVLTMGATSLFWYLVYEPSMTHAVSFGFVALFVAAAANCDARAASPKQLATIGFLLGLAFITRPQEAVFALLPAMAVVALREPLGQRVAIAGRYALWAFAGFAPLLILQLAHYYVLSSRERLVVVGGDDGFLNLFQSRWSETLFSSWHGFFSWTPIAYVAFLGTVAYAKRKWYWAVATLLVVFVMAWINGATPDLGAGWSFGGRRFVSCLVLLAPGLALIAQTIRVRPMLSLIAVALALIGWNVLLMAQYRSGMIPHDRPASFAQIMRQQADLYTRSPYLYPFAVPANLIFGWRTGLPVDRYDLLGTELLRREIDLGFSSSAGRFLLDGWGLPGGDDTGDAWWIAGSSASLVLPLQLGDASRIRVEIRARTRLADPVVQPTLTLHINAHEIGQFKPDAQQASTATFDIDKSGIWIDGFNRVTLTMDTAWPVAIYRIRVTPF